jgi:hypothetical protein
MKTVRSTVGPFSKRPYFKLHEIEEICDTELRATGLYPGRPEAIRIERFIEKRFAISPTYEPLPDGVLGFTKFGSGGVEAIVVAADLEDEGDAVKEGRLRATLAHEGGHGLLHAHLFALGTKPRSLFGDSDDEPEILCRDVPLRDSSSRRYNGRWWEYQANRAIGALLLPRRLAEHVMKEFCVPVGMLGSLALSPDKENDAIRALAETFKVNPVVARIRLPDIAPVQNRGQLLL